VESHLGRSHGAFQRFFQRLLPPSPGKWALEDGNSNPSAHKGAKTMFSNVRNQDQLACAFGALVFAGLSFGAALFPLIAA